MTNHVHLIAVPPTPCALADTLRDAHSAYALNFNNPNAAPAIFGRDGFTHASSMNHILWPRCGMWSAIPSGQVLHDKRKITGGRVRVRIAIFVATI